MFSMTPPAKVMLRMYELATGNTEDFIIEKSGALTWVRGFLSHDNAWALIKVEELP